MTTNHNQKESESVSSSSPTCQCQQPASLRTVRKEGSNQGRPFWGCAQWNRPNGCKFFKWADDTSSQQSATDTSNKKEQAADTSSTSIITSLSRSDETGLADSIKIVTLNVAQFRPHNLAPWSFHPREALQKELKRLVPDVLALQELPQPHEDISGYQWVGTARSHCGHVGLLVRRDFFREKVQKMTRMEVVPDGSLSAATFMAPELPVVLGCLQLYNGKEIVVGSCHLEPYKKGSEIRHAQLERISKATTSNQHQKAGLILAGDMNMRTREDAAVEALGEWKDAWKEAGSDRQHAYTWNSQINHYHGPDAFEFYCRFDRVYLLNVKGVQSFSLMANAPLGEDASHPYYLSDHFGIATTVLI